MAHRKKRAVFTAEPEQISEIEAQVRAGRYQSASAFLREAIQEKLARLQRERLEQQVESYCAESDELADSDMVDFQSFDEDDS